MNANQTSKGNVVIQDDDVTHCVLRMKSASSICDDYDFYTKKLEDSDGVGDPCYRVSFEIASSSVCGRCWGAAPERTVSCPPSRQLAPIVQESRIPASQHALSLYRWILRQTSEHANYLKAWLSYQQMRRNEVLRRNQAQLFLHCVQCQLALPIQIHR